eukprot:SAG31_NODE_4867_length_2899_cov_1.889643_2_plen_46_part_00
MLRTYGSGFVGWMQCEVNGIIIVHPTSNWQGSLLALPLIHADTAL